MDNPALSDGPLYVRFTRKWAAATHAKCAPGKPPGGEAKAWSQLPGLVKRYWISITERKKYTNGKLGPNIEKTYQNDCR
ncbi:hypothetical protein HNQ53_001073 [Microbulbifer hydrolyticus]|uniref:Uncharacterized protein n=1 Tax=Microbulbifer hydrolyticus TaxID=48074 RepID=A0AA89P9U7_9GAMM|nr:hypothetical protein [Microbulbifer hydrolyticus]